MSSTRLIWLGFYLPLAFTIILQGRNCKDDTSQKSKVNSTRPAASQVNHMAKEQERTPVPPGLWGGAGIRLQVTKDGAEIEYDCAHGRISEPIRLDAEGRFQVKGKHLRDRPGPVRLGETRNAQAASYEGNVKDQTMTLEVTLTAKTESIGSFTLKRGVEGRLRKCL
jgi:hypothetical protein